MKNLDKKIVKKFIPRVGAVGIAVYSVLASMADRSQGLFSLPEMYCRSPGLFKGHGKQGH